MTAKPGKPTLSVPSFTESEVPATVVAAKPNHFTEPLRKIAANVDDAGVSLHSLTFTVPTSEVEAQVRLAQRVGQELGVTVRKQVQGGATKGSSVIVLWTVPRIARPRVKDDASE